MNFSDLVLLAGLGWLVLLAATFTAAIMARPPRRADKVAARRLAVPQPTIQAVP